MSRKPTDDSCGVAVGIFWKCGSLGLQDFFQNILYIESELCKICWVFSRILLFFVSGEDLSRFI